MIKDNDFTTSIVVDKTPTEVFNAINNVRDWWQGEIIGETHQLGDEFDYRMKEHHFSKQQLVEIVPNEKVTWLVTDSSLNSFADKSEWTGTKIVFEITPLNHKTQLRFTHYGLKPTIDCYGACSGAWGKLVNESLFSLITTGKGIKVFG